VTLGAGSDRAPWAIGLMTGTIIDGMIDVAAIRTDGVDIREFGPWALVPYPEDLRSLLHQAFDAALDWQFRGVEPAVFAAAEDALTRAQAEAVNELLVGWGMRASDIGVVGFHGQTVLHRAPAAGVLGRTRQLGSGALMAALLGIDVVHDFRTADIVAGGHGAPVSASYHAALLRRIGADPDTAVLNLGGVANLTWCDESGAFLAFDTGPANGPINDWIARHASGEFDLDGRTAARGQVDEVLLRKMLDHPFFAAPYPKSLDRFDFTDAMAAGLSLEDGAATLTAFIAGTVDRSLDLLPVRPTRLVICGGGRKNPVLMQQLEVRAGVKAVSAEAVGWRGDAIEAECFGYLGVRMLAGLPISYPWTTGVPTPMTGGVLNKRPVLA
jgi:anhydro-N-acetylmuramic acid kinase